MPRDYGRDVNIRHGIVVSLYYQLETVTLFLI